MRRTVRTRRPVAVAQRRRVSPVNRRLSLRKFEPCTCHYQRKRPLACGYRGLRAVCSLCRLVARCAVAGRLVAVVTDIWRTDRRPRAVVAGRDAPPDPGFQVLEPGARQEIDLPRLAVPL